MEESEIIEGNKLIAVFMGMKIKGDWVVLGGGSEYVVTNLKYHSSWDQLMPVAEKISEDYDFSISSVGLWVCYISRKDSDFEDKHLGDMGGHEPVIVNAFKAIVQFIKWYNLQPKHKNNV